MGFLQKQVIHCSYRWSKFGVSLYHEQTSLPLHKAAKEHEGWMFLKHSVLIQLFFHCFPSLPMLLSGTFTVIFCPEQQELSHCYVL